MWDITREGGRARRSGLEGLGSKQGPGRQGVKGHLKGFFRSLLSVSGAPGGIWAKEARPAPSSYPGRITLTATQRTDTVRGDEGSNRKSGEEAL